MGVAVVVSCKSSYFGHNLVPATHSAGNNRTRERKPCKISEGGSC